MTRNFFIPAFPRSGTTWLANFFTYAGVFCHHEGIVGCEDIEAYAQKMSLRDYYMVGDSDSALTPYAQKIRERFPSSLWIGVRRDPLDVSRSLIAAQVPVMSQETFSNMVDLHEKVLKTCDIVVDFDTLFLIETLRNLWEAVTGMSLDERRAKMLIEVKVQPNLRRYAARYLRDIPLTMRASR